MTQRAVVIIVVGVVAAGLLMVVACGVGAVLFFRMVPAPQAAPAALARPGVIQGDGLFQKSVFLTDATVNAVTDLILLPDSQVGIAGTGGALFVNADGTVKSRIAFPSSPGFVQFVDVEGDGTWEFLNRGGRGWQKASLLDSNGQVTWTCGGSSAVDDVAAGDLDGDGILDFVVGYNGGGGVQRLDRTGAEKWQMPDGNVWHVEVVDTDGDGKPEIVHSNAGGQITVRNASGTVLRRSDPGPYFSDFSLCRWPTRKDRLYLITAEDDCIWIFDYDGKTLAKFDAPDAGTQGSARGTPVRLQAGGAECLAVAVAFQNWHSSILYIYGADKQLVYKEIIGDVCSAVLAVPRQDSEVDDLLVGGTGKVWKLSPVAPPKAGDAAEK